MLVHSAKDNKRFLFEAGSVGTAATNAFKTVKPNVHKAWSFQLDRFGLGNRLAATIAKGERARILVYGSDNGIFTAFMAELLEARKLLNDVDIITLDNDVERIEAGYRYCGSQGLPMNRLHFFVHDLQAPLDSCAELKLLQIQEFDWIYSFTTQHLPNARRHVERLYQALKPGGVINLVGWYQGEEGEYAWVSPHPALTPLMRAWFASTAEINPGVEVSTRQTEWLRESGAEVFQGVYSHPIGGTDKEGQAFMRWVLTVMHRFGPEFVAHGFISEAEYAQDLDRVYKELTPQAVGSIKSISTFARRPL